MKPDSREGVEEQWTPAAIFCHTSKQDCPNCPNQWIKNCRMPRTVKVLLNQKTPIPPPKSDPKYIRARKYDYPIQGSVINQFEDTYYDIGY